MKKWLHLSILAMSTLYIFFIPAQPEALKIFLKLVPMCLIIYMAMLQYKKASEKAHLFLLIGLVFGMIGDGTLRWFTVGLSAFLIGHIFYTISFLQQWKFSKWRAAFILPIYIYALLFGFQIIAALNKGENESLVIPVIVYIFVIATMLWLAVMTGQKLAILGALSFLISDSLLSWDMFVNNLGEWDFLIMVTYYAAQYSIASSVGRKKFQDMIHRFDDSQEI